MGKTLADTVAERVRAELAVKRVTGAELARRMGVSHAYVSRRLNGHEPFDVAELGEIADLIEVPVDRLLAPWPGGERVA